MKYTHSDLGFLLELPDGWRMQRGNQVVYVAGVERKAPPTIFFFGPSSVDKTSEYIQLEIGTLPSNYFDAGERETYLKEPQATVGRTTVGGEDNAVYLRRDRGYSELSVVRDGIHYVFTHSNDPVTEGAVAHLKANTRFGSREQSAATIEAWRPLRATDGPRATLHDPPLTGALAIIEKHLDVTLPRTVE
jgi:hypothetical protein